VAGESVREGTGERTSERTGAADDESRGRERGRGRQRRDERRDLNRVGRGVINYWIVLGLGAGLHAYRRRRDEEERAGELELSSAHLQAELAEARLDVLRGQLQPHFLFNALHTVGGLIREEQPDTALRALGALGDVLRTTLRQAEQHEVSLADELEVVRRYLELERLRMGERLETQLPDAGELDAALGSARVPVLVLLPLIENAVRHGLAPLQDGGTLQVLVERRGPSLVLVVQDDGPGFPDEVLRGRATDGERPSIGLANTRERLITLYGDAGRLELTNPEAGGARAEVHLPLSAGTAPS